jgi:menaquinone-specific isochorismate synthase
MPIQKILEEFSNFLTDKKSALNKSNSQEFLFSFQLPQNSFEFKENLTLLIDKHPNLFYFESFEKDLILYGIGNAFQISENGLGRFSSLNKKISELKERLICNWDGDQNTIPLIVGGMKYSVEHSEDEWEDFKDSDWFVPEFLIVKTNGEKRVYYNFTAKNISVNKLVENFMKKLKVLEEFHSENPSSKIKIISSKGLSPKDKKKWKQLADDSIHKLSGQEISKIVLARRVELTLSSQLNWESVKKYLSENYPDCSIFFYHKSDSTFFGASPERLAKFERGKIAVDVLAGSIARGASEVDDTFFERQMLASTKLQHEHDLVIHQLKKSLSKFVTKINVEKIPFKKLKNIQHLHTVLKTELLPDKSIFEIIDSIFPTAAVCGEPKDKAMALLKKIEDYNRGFYSGIIGWLNLKNEGDFVVGIRSAILHRNNLFAYAGCGIVAGSDPADEYHETEMKLKAILNYFDEQN